MVMWLLRGAYKDCVSVGILCASVYPRWTAPPIWLIFELVFVKEWLLCMAIRLIRLNCVFDILLFVGGLQLPEDPIPGR